MKKEKKGKKGKGTTAPDAARKLGRTTYETELARMHGELVHLQQWVVHKGSPRPGRRRHGLFPVSARYFARAGGARSQPLL
jgi:hypothetical protein